MNRAMIRGEDHCAFVSSILMQLSSDFFCCFVSALTSTQLLSDERGARHLYRWSFHHLAIVSALTRMMVVVVMSTTKMVATLSLTHWADR